MIASLTGQLRAKSPTEVLLEVHGVGYAVHVPLSTYAALGEVGGTVTLLTHLQVREDAMVLFGFATEDERAMFRLLLSVTGIGPKLAQNILSGVPAAELRGLIRAGNAAALFRIRRDAEGTRRPQLSRTADRRRPGPARPARAGRADL